MSELAFNLSGDPFEVPNRAVGWRVRRMKPKGAPEVVYGRNGLPLVLPIDAEVDDLRHEANAPGRYRLDPVADNNKPIEDAIAAYVFIHEDRAPAIHERAPVATTTDNALIEAMRINAELARTIVDRFPVMMESAGLLLRAAGAVGLPARMLNRALEMGTDDDEDDDGDGEAAPAAAGFDITALAAQAIPLVVTALSSGNLKLPSVASLLDWRKAAPTHAANAAASAEAPTSRASETKAAQSTAASSPLPPMDPAMMTHFLAIQNALQPSEAAMARAVAADLQPAELRAWFDDLSKLSVSEAVTKIRAMIGGGSAS